MKKTIFKTYLTTLLALLLAFMLTLTAFACSSDKKDSSDDNAEESSFTSKVENGDFSGIKDDSAAQPYEPNNWSVSKGKYDSENPSVSGIVDTGADYDKNSTAWGSLANPYGKVTNEKVLMIYNKELNAYGYTNTFTTNKYETYKVTVDVKAVNVSAADGTEGGATIRISSTNGYGMFTDINATDEFTTYTFYLSTSSVDNTKVTVLLSLGYGEKQIKGYAFFDNVVVEKIDTDEEKEAYTAAKEAYDAAEDKAALRTQFIDMLYSDGEFDYYDYKSDETSIHTPVSWSWNEKTLTDTEKSVLKGIVSVSDKASWDETMKATYGDYPALPVEDSADDHVLMIKATATNYAYAPIAASYNSATKVKIDAATLYEISVWTKVIVDRNDDYISDYSKLGARIVLDAGDTAAYETNKYSTFVINTSDKKGLDGNYEWVQVKIYVLGNQNADRDFTIQLWLGDDEKLDRLTQGTAFFDKLQIRRIDSYTMSDFSSIAAEYEGKVNAATYVDFFNLLSEDDNLNTNGYFKTDANADGKPDGYLFNALKDVKVAEGDVTVAVLNKEKLSAEEWTDEDKAAYGLDENPGYPIGYDSVLLVNNRIPTAYSFATEDYIEIKQNLAYKISVWLKTYLDDGKNVTVKLVEKDDSEEAGADPDSFEGFSVSKNTSSATDNNGYIEFTFYIKGELSSLNGASNSHFVRLMITNGSGSAVDPSSFQKGAFLLAGISVKQISYKEFNAASDSQTYGKKSSLASNSSTGVTNGNFNSYDDEKTEYNSEGYVALSDKDGKTHLTAGISDWTNNANDKFGTEVKSDTQTLHIKKTAENNNKNSFFVDLSDGKKITSIRVTGTFGYDKTFDKEEDWKKVFTSKDKGRYIWATTSTDKSYTLKKTAENNAENYAAITLSDEVEIVSVKLNGTTYTKAEDWTKYVLFDLGAGKITWADTEVVSNLAAQNYEITVTTDLKTGTYTVVVTTEETEYNKLIAGILNIDNSDAYLKQFGFDDGKDAIYAGNWNDAVAADTKEKNVDFGAPNLLMITTRNGAEISLEDAYEDTSKKENMIPVLKSPLIKAGSSDHLENNSFYLLRCYAKAFGNDNTPIAQIYVTTNSTDSDLAYYTVYKTGNWVEYNFLVATSLTDINAYFEIYYGEKDNLTTKYSGTVLFDSFSATELTEEEYNELLKKENSENVKFTTIAFNDPSAKETLTTPTGFTKENTSANSTTSVSGIISKDFKTESDSTSVEIKEYLGLIDTVPDTDENGDPKTDSDGKEKTKDVLVEGSALTIDEIFATDGLPEGTQLGDYLLIINNRKESYQSYSTSLTLKREEEDASYYRFSAYVRTAFIEEGKYAKVYVTTNNGNDTTSFKVNTSVYDEEGNVTSNDWTLLTFYLKDAKAIPEDSSTESTDTCTLYFRLGEKDSEEVRGYLFVDNVSLTKITFDEYKEGTKDYEIYETDPETDKEIIGDDGNPVLSEKSETYRLTNKVIVLEDEEDDTPETDNSGSTQKAKAAMNVDDNLGTYIVTAVIALILIAVIVILLFKKYYRPGKHSKVKKAGYDRRNSKKEESSNDDATSTSTGTARDEYKD